MMLVKMVSLKAIVQLERLRRKNAETRYFKVSLKWDSANNILWFREGVWLLEASPQDGIWLRQNWKLDLWEFRWEFIVGKSRKGMGREGKGRDEKETARY